MSERFAKFDMRRFGVIAAILLAQCPIIAVASYFLDGYRSTSPFVSAAAIGGLLTWDVIVCTAAWAVMYHWWSKCPACHKRRAYLHPKLSLAEYHVVRRFAGGAG